MKDKPRMVTAEITMADLKKARKRLRKARRDRPFLTPKEIRKRMRKLLPAKLAEIEAKKAKGYPRLIRRKALALTSPSSCS